MKKRLNLFSKKKRFNAFASYANKIKRFGTIIGLIFFVLFVITITRTIILRAEMNDLLKKKQLYLSLLMEEKDVEANIRFFKGKQTQLYTYEKDDARFAPYYSILLDMLNTSTDSATLDSIEIDKTRSTSFVIKFKDYETMISFLKYVESEEFLKNFDELSMASLSLNRDVVVVSTARYANKNFQLQFKGKFKELNEESN